MTLRRALLLLLVLVLVLGLLPAGLLLQERLEAALLERARADLSSAPMVLEDRLASVKTVRMMHARDFSTMPGLVEAFLEDDLDRARRMLEAAALQVQEAPVLLDGEGLARTGPGPVPGALVEATRRGEMPVAVVQMDSLLHLLALAPVGTGDAWLGAVGGSTPFDEAEAAALAGLTGSGVVIVDGTGAVVASTVDPAMARAVAGEVDHVDGEVRDHALPSGGVLVAGSPLDQGRVLFVREVERELAVLPELRATAFLILVAVLASSLVVGALFARRLARPVSELADAVEDFGAGRPEMPLRTSRILEVRRLAGSFGTMRATLARRLTDLEDANRALEAANRELEDRQARLAALQAELVQRERLATSGRLLAQLAHEIRNPVASVRNCLEVVRRRGQLEGEAARFADMAVEELLRMHELAERMLDLHRPRERGTTSCDAAAVARETVQLLRAGAGPEGSSVSASGDPGVRARIPPDDLKQVLLNLALNAVEASPEEAPVEVVTSVSGDRVRVEVLDRGPGIPDEVAERIFDPFFTTKEAVHGVGLGLYTADGLVRAAGGTLRAAPREPGPGTRFVVELPVEEEDA